MNATSWADVEAPDVNDRELAEYWRGTAKRQLLAQSCVQCGAFRWPPRAACGACRSLEAAWTSVGHSGRLFSWTVVWQTTLKVFKDNTPYAVGVVQLDWAPIRMIGHLEIGVTNLAMDMAVRVEFREVRGGVLLPVWVAAGS